MKHLFSAEGKRALRAALAAEPLLAFDFDGTLAPITANPADAAVPLSVMRRLLGLNERLLLAIVSGRAVEDVRSRLAFAPWRIIGNHGTDGWDRPPPAVLSTGLDRLREVMALNADHLGVLGILAEDKHWSIALHFRMARDRGAARTFIDRLLAEARRDEGAVTLAVSHGKCVTNVMVEGAPDKGTALLRLAAESRVACGVFVGDDANDEPAFLAAPPDWMTVRIGGSCRASGARFFLEDHAQVAALLQDMLDQLAA